MTIEEVVVKLYELKWRHTRIKGQLEMMTRHLAETEAKIAAQMEPDTIYHIPGLIDLEVVAVKDGDTVRFDQFERLDFVENEDGEISLEDMETQVDRLVHDRIRTGTDLCQSFPDYRFQFNDFDEVPTVEEILRTTRPSSSYADDF